MTKNAWDIVHEVCPEFIEVKKVLYKVHGHIKCEIYSPLINVIFLSGDKMEKKEISHRNIKEYIVKVPISKFMHSQDLYKLL